MHTKRETDFQGEEVKEIIPTEDQYNEACELFGMPGLSLLELRNRKERDAYAKMRTRFLEFAKKSHPDKAEDKSKEGIAKANDFFNKICNSWKHIEYFITHPTVSFSTSSRASKFVNFLNVPTLTLDDYQNLEEFNHRISLETIIQKFLAEDKEIEVFLRRFELFKERLLSHTQTDSDILEKYAKDILNKTTRTPRENIFLGMCHILITDRFIPFVEDSKEDYLYNKFLLPHIHRKNCWEHAFKILELGKEDKFYPYYQALFYANHPDYEKRITTLEQINLFIQVAKDNVAVAFSHLAELAENIDTKQQLFSMAAAAGEPEAMNGLGEVLLKLEKNEEGIKWLQQGMRLGSEKAALTLAYNLKEQKKEEIAIRYHRAIAALTQAVASTAQV